MKELKYLRRYFEERKGSSIYVDEIVKYIVFIITNTGLRISELTNLK